ncbi:MAG: UDP-N-acetylglucosamine 1-carboxyvinyltransferase [Puniceicoccales bacterium]|jgi:UDP-N-acetylglucosamine 1-carboxyvinyltransferase|nr:UDP-N-acetylglucosamine 1-carboxyvinyltransferase [Puniceicoccales bacterium]
MNDKTRRWEAYIEGIEDGLKGTVTVSGSKNASFPVLAATLLTKDPCFVQNVPQLRDIEVMLSLLGSLGTDIQKQKDGSWRLQSAVIGSGKKVPDGHLITKIRGSVYFLGALLAHQGYAEMPFPGGCSFGDRPIDLHLRGFEALGAHVTVQPDKIILIAPDGLRGATIFLGGPVGGSVTGTANILLAAVLAKGVTRIEYAACEPEVVELCQLLVAMGAHIRGIGSPILEIEGVDTLKGFSHMMASDRIEAGTWVLIGLCAGHATQPIIIQGFPQENLGALLFVLQEMGAIWDLSGDCMRILGGQNLRATAVHALPYPGFPTDLQAPMAVLMSLAQGESEIYDHIYPKRFLYAEELKRMGAHVEIFSGALKICQSSLRGARVQATDLRAGVALYIAGLVAEGVTQIAKAEYVDRGYEHFEEKLRNLGAHVQKRAVDVDR